MTFTPEILYGLGALLLLGVLVWGVRQVKTRNRANDPITDEATRELYDDATHYEETREDLEKQVRPS